MLKKSKLLSAAIFSAATLLAANGQADTMGTPKISAMSIVNGLENPWDMAFTKNGDIYFIKAGDLVEFPAGLNCEWEVTKSIKKHYRLGS